MAHYIDHPLIKSDSIEARLYQQVLAADVLKKGNTMIVAPTALGKEALQFPGNKFYIDWIKLKTLKY